MKRRLFLAIGILALCLPLFVSAGSSGYFPHAIGDFDGSSDYFTRGADLTGNVNGKVGLFSCWFRKDGGDGAQRNFLWNHGTQFYVAILATDKLTVSARNIGFAGVFQQTTTGTYLTEAIWHNFLASWDLANSKAYIYVDNVSVGAVPSTLVDDEIDYTRPDWGLAATNIGGNLFDGALSEFFFALEYLDISVESNRRLFIDASGNPVPLGIDGSYPTGTAPIIYMRNRYNNGGLNSGTGGDFTVNGSPDYSEGPVPFFPLSTWTPGRGMSSGMRIH